MNNCTQILGYSWKVIATSVVLLALTLLEIILSFFVSSYTLHGNYNENNKCYRYLSQGLESASQNYDGNMDKFNSWRQKFEEKMISDIKYYCDKIGIPTFTFALLQSLSFIGVIFGFVFIIKNPSNRKTNSYLENNAD